LRRSNRSVHGTPSVGYVQGDHQNRGPDLGGRSREGRARRGGNARGVGGGLMPNRILREGILTSPRIAKLGWPEEVFYRRLMSVVDDFGRYYADPGLLRAACYPRQLNKVSDS